MKAMLPIGVIPITRNLALMCKAIVVTLVIASAAHETNEIDSRI
jgi:hypothetical protein